MKRTESRSFSVLAITFFFLDSFKTATRLTLIGLGLVVIFRKRHGRLRLRPHLRLQRTCRPRSFPRS
jgi:hypothetical protein